MAAGHRTFAWTEMPTADPGKAKAIFGATLGWTYDQFPLPEGAYWVVKIGDQRAGDIGEIGTGDVPTDSAYRMAFIEVDDVDARIERAVAQGATVLRVAHDVANVGRVPVLHNPTGAPIGWMTSNNPAAVG